MLARWAAHAPAILRRAPVLELHGRHAGGDVEDEAYEEREFLPAAPLGALFAVQGVERVRVMGFTDYTLGPTAARVFLNEGHHLRLSVLRLRHRSLPPRLIRMLQERFKDALILDEAHPPAYGADEEIPF